MTMNRLYIVTGCDWKNYNQVSKITDEEGLGKWLTKMFTTFRKDITRTDSQVFDEVKERGYSFFRLDEMDVEYKIYSIEQMKKDYSLISSE